MKKIRIELYSLLIWAGVVMISLNADINNIEPSWYTFTGSGMVLLATALWSFPVIWNHAYKDAQLIIHSHASRFVIRGLLMFVTSLVFTRDLQTALSLTFFMASYFWLVFDLAYNIHKGRELLYVGNTSIIDRFWNRSPVLMLIAKAVCLLSSIAIFNNVF